MIGESHQVIFLPWFGWLYTVAIDFVQNSGAEMSENGRVSSPPEATKPQTQQFSDSVI